MVNNYSNTRIGLITLIETAQFVFFRLFTACKVQIVRFILAAFLRRLFNSKFTFLTIRW